MTALVTKTAAADMLRMSVRNVDRLRAAGDLRFIPGRPVKIPVADITAYIEGRLQCAAAPEALGSCSTSTASMKSVGRKPGERDAARLAQRIMASLKKF